MTILVTIKNNYGTEAIYPACDKSQSFASLAGKKTLSRSDIATIKSLGFIVEVKQETKSL